MKHLEIRVESVILVPELRIKSVAFTPDPMATGAFLLLLTDPFFRLDATFIDAYSPIFTFLILP